MTDSEALPHDIADDSVEPEPAPAPSAEPDPTPDAPVPAEADAAPEPPTAAEADPAPELASASPVQPDPRPAPLFAAPAASPPQPVVTAASAEIERLRLEIAHRDQMLLSARERRVGLEREIGRLERQLDGAIEAQRDAATERAELRRLLGNVQMQVQSLMQLPAPAEQPEQPKDGEESVSASEPVSGAPARARPWRAPRTAESIVYAQPAGADEHETEEPADQGPSSAGSRRGRSRRHGLVDDARDVLSSLRRLW